MLQLTTLTMLVELVSTVVGAWSIPTVRATQLPWGVWTSLCSSSKISHTQCGSPTIS